MITIPRLKKRLQEITKSDYGVGKIGTQKDVVKKIQSAVSKNMEVSENPLNGKVVVDDSNGGVKFQCEITECGEGLYDVVVIKNGSDRKVGKQIDMDKLLEFLKDSVKEEKSYKEKSFEKGNPNRKKNKQ